MQLSSGSSSPPLAVPVPKTRTFNSVRREKLAVVLLFLLSPAIIYVGLVLFPMLQAMYYSLFRWSGLGPAEDFIGFNNFIRMFRDGVFLKSLGNNVVIVILSILVQLPLALALALLIRRQMVGRRLFRLIFFLPFVLSEVITGVLTALRGRGSTTSAACPRSNAASELLMVCRLAATQPVTRSPGRTRSPRSALNFSSLTNSHNRSSDSGEYLKKAQALEGVSCLTA